MKVLVDWVIDGNLVGFQEVVVNESPSVEYDESDEYEWGEVFIMYSLDPNRWVTQSIKSTKRWEEEALFASIYFWCALGKGFFCESFHFKFFLLPPFLPVRDISGYSQLYTFRLICYPPPIVLQRYSQPCIVCCFEEAEIDIAWTSCARNFIAVKSILTIIATDGIIILYAHPKHLLPSIPWI